MIMKLIQLLMMVVWLASLAACSSMKIEPWVKPYERTNLADPIMSYERDAISGAYIRHVFESREASRGGGGGAGGGCGCN